MAGAPEDTICAVATPAGEGGIGIVRISGRGALVVAEQIVRLRSNQSLARVSSHTLHLADILVRDHSGDRSVAAHHRFPSGEAIIDEGLVVYMKGPHSFTAEDVVEIHCHGSGVVLGRVCEACVSAGARLAEPGEFTKRAFLNGRLDLSQAEAVLDTVKARSDAALRVAQRHLRGELGQYVTALRSRLLGLLAHVEAGIDFVEEEIAFVGREELIGSLEDTVRAIDTLLVTAETARVLREGARVVIMGRPNAGKSSLLNRLLREDRAIVTDVPGTTRDVLEESVMWGGLAVTLLDTAGLRETEDVVEQEGIRRARLAQESGDMALHVLDAVQLNVNGLEGRIPDSRRRQDLILLNKSDLVDAASLEHLVRSVEERTGGSVHCISARTGAGVEELRELIRSRLSGSSLEAGEGVVVTSMRHRLALTRARRMVGEALESTRKGREPEFVALDLRGACDALGEITGVITSDEILNRIFAEFCIGK